MTKKDLEYKKGQYEALKTAFKEKYPCVDILLDDGGHTMNQQITTFREMFPHIQDGGLYMCED